jgi:hypothetical protein
VLHCPVAKDHKPAYLAVLVAMPVIIFLLNRNWPFGGFGDYDSFYYLGYFIHYPHYQILRRTYAGERLPWILPGYALVHTFGPVYGTLALHLAATYASTLSLFSIVTRFSGSQAGFLSAFALSAHPYFLAANAIDYVMGGCIAYCLVALMLLVRSAPVETGWRWLMLCAAGMCWACAIYSYPLWALLTPATLAVYLAAKNETGLRDALISAIAFSIGLAVVTLALMGLHYRIFHEGGLAFQKVSISMTHFLSTINDNPWMRGDPLFFTYADWLVYPEAAAGIAIVGLIPRCRQWLKLRPETSLLLLAYLYMAAVMFIETILPGRFLMFDYVASFLLPGAFIVFGVTIFDVRMELRRQWFWLVVACAGFISVAPLAKPGLYVRQPMFAALLPTVLLGGALAIRLSRPASVVGVLVMALGLAEASFCLTPVIGGDAWRNRVDLRASIGRIGNVVRIIEGRLPWDRYPAFWFSGKSPNSLEYQAIMCSFPSSYGDSLQAFPEMPAERKLSAGQVFVLLADSPRGFDEASAAIASRGLHLAHLWDEVVVSAGTQYWVTATEILQTKTEQ